MKFLLIFIILVYIIYKVTRYLNKIFQGTGPKDKPFMNKNSGKTNKSSVDKKDIIDAEFEEIDESKKSK